MLCIIINLLGHLASSDLSEQSVIPSHFSDLSIHIEPSSHLFCVFFGHPVQEKICIEYKMFLIQLEIKMTLQKM